MQVSNWGDVWVSFPRQWDLDQMVQDVKVCLHVAQHLLPMILPTPPATRHLWVPLHPPAELWQHIGSLPAEAAAKALIKTFVNRKIRRNKVLNARSVHDLFKTYWSLQSWLLLPGLWTCKCHGSIFTWRVLHGLPQKNHLKTCFWNLQGVNKLANNGKKNFILKVYYIKIRKNNDAAIQVMGVTHCWLTQFNTYSLLRARQDVFCIFCEQVLDSAASVN